MTGAALEVAIRIARPAFTLDVRFRTEGAITVLCGPSGSGKSSTLAAVAGLVAIDVGRVAIGNEVWFDSKAGVDRPVHERGAGFVFQSLALFPHMTARENVAYGIPKGTAKEARREEAERALARWRVGHLADRKVPTLSGGEAQRVALARAFAMRPRVVLLDEPFSALDPALRRELAAELKSAVGALGVPALAVTHYADEAEALGERAIRLVAGRVAGEGAPRALFAEEA
jgi:ABC-type sulfate/molybdate transport systems ATPase subunit